jgi:hypothetical protein
MEAQAGPGLTFSALGKKSVAPARARHADARRNASVLRAWNIR